MGMITAYHTDKGIKKTVNQDALLIQQAKLNNQEIMLAVVCDGMGGLAKGELASATLIKSMSHWFRTRVPGLAGTGFTQQELWNQWNAIVQENNRKMQEYGRTNGCRLGTTITGFLTIGEKYYVIHVGDSRLYEISDALYQITEDQTVVAREIRLGRMTKEQALQDPRRNVLLQCIGASEEVTPDFLSGNLKKEAVYLLCSDGFRHEITPQEIWENFSSGALTNESGMKKNAERMTELIKARQETDNISVILIKVPEEEYHG